jgi:hypothetical protein
MNGAYHYHALVKRKGKNPAMLGRTMAWLEDPSRRLGMGWEKVYAEQMKKRGIEPRSALWDEDEVEPKIGIGWGGMGDISWKCLYQIGSVP